MVLAKLTTGVDVFSDWIIVTEPTSASSSDVCSTWRDFKNRRQLLASMWDACSQRLYEEMKCEWIKKLMITRAIWVFGSLRESHGTFLITCIMRSETVDQGLIPSSYISWGFFLGCYCRMWSMDYGRFYDGKKTLWCCTRKEQILQLCIYRGLYIQLMLSYRAILLTLLNILGWKVRVYDISSLPETACIHYMM